MDAVSATAGVGRDFQADDYRLIGGAGERAKAAGLINATWYKSEVPRPVMKSLMKRQDARAIRDTLLWYSLILASGVAAYASLGTGWAVLAFFVYGTLYAGPADSRWHECSHGTAFKTTWMNNVVYQLACFQVFRRPTRWRWSHSRHHTNTLVVGNDPEIASQLPIRWFTVLLNVIGYSQIRSEIPKIVLNALGRMDAEEKTFIPESEWPRMFREARAWLAIYAALIALCVIEGTALPLLFIGLPSLYGAWLYSFFGMTQHAGLPENVTDHRLNCRTVYMNPVFRFLYWNMNYHLEHHMFPMVPYHALPQLHEAIKADCPPPYASTLEAYAEIIPTLIRQHDEPSYHVQRPLPKAA
jgi:fatty acid desaturase